MNLLGVLRASLLMLAKMTVGFGNWLGTRPSGRIALMMVHYSLLCLALAGGSFVTGCATNKAPAQTESSRSGPNGCLVGDPAPLKWWEYALLPLSVPYCVFKEAQHTPGVMLWK